MMSIAEMYREMEAHMPMIEQEKLVEIMSQDCPKCGNFIMYVGFTSVYGSRHFGVCGHCNTAEEYK